MVFTNSLNDEFVNFDDDVYVIDNVDIAELSFSNLTSYFTKTYVGHYQPLTISVYAPNHTINLLFFGPVKLKYIAIVTIVLDVLSIASSNAGMILLSAYAFLSTSLASVTFSAIDVF